MNYNEAMEYIENTAKFGMNLGLERILKILEYLDNPQDKIKCIHVGGTNGKGSTTAMISSILIEEGYKVGMYTSPYLEEFEERIQVNGENIKKQELASIITEIKSAISKVDVIKFGTPTQFEIITALMFYYFAKEESRDIFFLLRCDQFIIETRIYQKSSKVMGYEMRWFQIVKENKYGTRHSWI